jgi:hypothetical protein
MVIFYPKSISIEAFIYVRSMAGWGIQSTGSEGREGGEHKNQHTPGAGIYIKTR